jgi:hypothetical protein
MADPEASNVDLRFRANLGMRIVTGATIALGALGVAALWGAWQAAGDNKTVFVDQARELLNLLLPVLGTWVGTVLAYYFGKENFESAHRAALETFKAVGGVGMDSADVSDVMRPRGSFAYLSVPAGGVGAIKLADIDAKFGASEGGAVSVNRLLLLDEQSKAQGIIHLSTWALMKADAQAASVDVGTAGLSAMLSRAFTSKAGKTYADIITKTLACVALDKTLADAKSAMQAVPGCEDVVVTKSGAITDPVLGWIPSTIILRLSTA